MLNTVYLSGHLPPSAFPEHTTDMTTPDYTSKNPSPLICSQSPDSGFPSHVPKTIQNQISNAKKIWQTSRTRQI